MPPPQLTVDELVATIKRTHLPTIIVEGSDDLTVYRHIESMIQIPQANVLPCGGRDALLELFRRRSEFASKQIAFIADRDMWLYGSIPSAYDGIIWTDGYSIENDIYVDSDIERLLDDSEALEHKTLIASLCRWFAFEVEEYLAGREFRVKCSAMEVVPPGQTDISAGFIAKRGFREPQPHVYADISLNYQFKLRGKQLIQVLVRYLSASSRAAKYSVAAIIELCVKTRGHPRVAKILAQLTKELNPS